MHAQKATCTLRYEAKAKPKQADKAREIGGAEETEMNKGRSVELYRTIDLDVECRCDHDGATPEA